MPTIFVSPGTTSEDATTPEVMGLEIVVQPEDWFGFDLLEVWRSTLGQAGPYEELTSALGMAARNPAGVGDPPASPVTGALLNIVGKQLKVWVGELSYWLITFTGSDPLTLAQVAQQVTAQGMGDVQAYVDPSGRFVLQTSQIGTAARLKVSEGDAAALLGLNTDDWFFGRDARLTLQANQNIYRLMDTFGSRDYFYKTRFRNAATGATSSMSSAVAADTVVGLPAESMVIGRLELVDLNGKPLMDCEVRVGNSFKGQVIGGKVIAGTSDVKRTDSNGRVEFLLVRGQQVTVAIVGTSLVKDVIPPTDPAVTIFNLLDPALGPQQDYFRVRVPEIAVADRRNL
jgi:hypothetical protein